MSITSGATSGIGRSAAILFNKLGASLIITGRAKESLDALVHEHFKNKEVWMLSYYFFMN